MSDSNKIKKIVGANFKKLRNAKNLTQEQLAEALKMQPNSIALIETGRTFISSELLSNASNFFNVEPSVFFKSTFIEETDKTKNLKKEITRLLSDCNEDFVERVYNVIIALKK